MNQETISWYLLFQAVGILSFFLAFIFPPYKPSYFKIEC